MEKSVKEQETEPSFRGLVANQKADLPLLLFTTNFFNLLQGTAQSH